MKLRYTGPVTVTFHTAGVGDVEPGAEFTVPDELAVAFTGRSDIEEVTEPVVKPGRKKATPTQSAEMELLPIAVDAVPAVDAETEKE